MSARAAALLCALLAGATAAQAPPAITADTLATFFDGYLPVALQRGQVPGAVVVVVKDGAVLWSKGYGYADVAAHTPVDPATTLFRPGSISKTFMWTAVMQLVEQNKLDLDGDVNAYLDFRIPEDGGKPITLRALMTHTSGLEETQKNIAFTDPARALGNEQFLKKWVPSRIYPVGQVTAYSNYGAALAGYIVERVSGQPFAQYVQEHLLAPLHMTHSTFQQPPPDLTHAAKPYRAASGPVQPYELIAPAPAGSMSVTGLDMAQFMIAHLQDGRLGDARILEEDTARLMHATAYTPVAPLNGMALGFYHEDRNGQRIIGHAGGTTYFFSNMHLFLDAQVGVFISMNGIGADGAAAAIRKQLLPQFADRFFPVAVAAEAQTPTAQEHGRQVTGMYETSRRSGHNFGTFFSLFNQSRLALAPDGTLSFALLKDAGGAPLRWREVSPYLWREAGGSRSLAVKMENGRAAGCYADVDAPTSMWLPVPSSRSAAWNMPLLIVSQLVLLLTLLKWPLAAWLRRRSGAAIAGDVQQLRRVRAVCLANFLFVGGLLLYIVLVIAPGIVPFTDQINPVLRAFQLCGLVGALGTPLVLIDAFTAWRSPHARWRRFASACVAASCVATVWIGCAFGLFSISLDF